VKKTQSPTRSGGKGSKTSAPRSGKAGAKAGAKSGAARKAGRIPVRGSLKSGGVKDRAAAAPSVPAPRPGIEQIRALAIAAIDAALEKKALAPVLIDVSGMASYTDFIGIVSGRSDRQVDAIAESVRQVMKQQGKYTLGQEGTGGGRWTLLDFGSVVIHVFHHPVREFYDLESLWIEAPRVPLDIPAESTLSESESYYGAL
jgi:ribosome-associated protein